MEESKSGMTWLGVLFFVVILLVLLGGGLGQCGGGLWGGRGNCGGYAPEGLSASMMLRYSFDLDKEADAIDSAVKQVLKDGYRTGDIMSDGCEKVGCKKMGDLIVERIK